MTSSNALFTPEPDLNDTALTRAWRNVGTLVQMDLNKPVDVYKVTQKGLDPAVIEDLLNRGFSRNNISWIIPPRTLRHRREKNEPLTPEESGRFLRAAKLYALAVEVLGGEEKAKTWLLKPRKIFDGYSAMDLMQSEVGAEVVQEKLCQLDAGYFA
jgi:putative toxin-antitoxin system antitoxin component (TIGR02293 family)